MMKSNYRCPVCTTKLEANERYPRYVCPPCAEKTCDAQGRKVSFRNLSFEGGCEGYYPDTDEKYLNQDCFIEGHACYADEARFGGIVIQLKD